jgi:hypothetical protein
VQLRKPRVSEPAAIQTASGLTRQIDTSRKLAIPASRLGQPEVTSLKIRNPESQMEGRRDVFER